MSKVTLLDLTVGQVEHIEDAIGLPVNRWQGEASKARLYALILAAAEGKPVEAYKDRTMRDLVSLVSIDGADDEDPTPPSEP